jgi:hypothetical protein
MRLTGSRSNPVVGDVETVVLDDELTSLIRGGDGGHLSQRLRSGALPWRSSSAAQKMRVVADVLATRVMLLKRSTS